MRDLRNRLDAGRGRPGAARGDERDARPPRARLGGNRRPRRRGTRGAAARDHRPRHRRSADPERGRDGPRRPERRDLQLPRAAPRARARRPPLPHARRHRGARACLRGVGRHVRAAAARDVRGGDLGRPAAAPAARARPVRDQAALLPRVGRRAAVRVGAAGASARRGRPRRSRLLPRLQLRAGAVLDLPRYPQAAARPRAGVGGRRAADRAVLDGSAGGRRGRTSRRRGRARRGAARTASGLGARAPRERRPRRRPALGRRRFGRACGTRRSGEPGAAAHVLDRLPGELVQRALRRAAGGREVFDPAPRAGRPTGRGAASTGARGRVRRAFRRLLGAADLPRLAARGGGCEGRTLGRGRR